jgi:NADPH2:quinone reductase
LRAAREMFEMIEDGYVKIPVHAKAKLSDAIDVHRALESRATTGATILIP